VGTAIPSRFRKLGDVHLRSIQEAKQGQMTVRHVRPTLGYESLTECR
jgi:hypothetical protein